MVTQALLITYFREILNQLCIKAPRNRCLSYFIYSVTFSYHSNYGWILPFKECIEWVKLYIFKLAFKKIQKKLFSSKSNISHLAYITGRIRDLGSNSSHETRIARLLATLQLKSFFCIFIHSRRYTLYKLINNNKTINKW